MESSRLDEVLARIALDRLRTLVPVLLFGLVMSLAISEPVGVPITTGVLVTNVIVIGIAAIACVALLTRRVPLRLAHHLAAVICCCAPTTTLASQWATGRSGLLLLLVIAVIASAVQLSTRHLLVSATLSTLAWLPVGARDAGEDFGLQVGVVATTIVVTVVIHRMLLRSLLDAEHARADERRSAAALQRELAERVQIESERVAMAERLAHSQRLEAVGTLAAGIAHEMNNVLAGIIGVAEARNLETPDPATREDCTQILAQVERGATLTRSLLAFSRRGQYRRRPMALEGVIDSVSPMLSRTLPRDVVVEHVIAANPTVDVDVVQLGQVLMNLCINASEAMAGSGRLVIERRTTKLDEERLRKLGLDAARKEWAILAVSDTGRGMDERVLARIFEPFFTTKPVGTGSGLGLAMAWGVIEAHGGTIAVDTRPGGSRFEVILPIASHAPPPEPTPATTSAGWTGQLALVVDDEPLLRRATGRLLELLGFQTCFAENGREALDVHAARASAITLVVLDVAMPVMGGVECFHRLRERSEVPVLLVSGYALASDMRELLTSSRTGFLEKPYTRPELIAALDRLLPARAAAKTPASS